jgi:hypothetical protein
LIDLLTGGVREVQIFLGYANGSVQDPAIVNPPRLFQDAVDGKLLVFTGLTTSVPVTENYAIDRLVLECKEKTQIIEDFPILNSPIFDGMSVKSFFLCAARLGGLPLEALEVDSTSAHQLFLGIGYTIKDFAVKYAEGTKIYEAIKKVSTQYWHVLRCNPDGKISLTELNTTGAANGVNNITTVGRYARIEDLNITHPSYVFYVDAKAAADQGVSPFQKTYGDFTINRNLLSNYTNIEIFSVDRGMNGQNMWTLVNDTSSWDTESIENPDSKNFIGYQKPFRDADPAIGSREKITEMRNNLGAHMYENILNISFRTFGRVSLRSYDIIQIVLPVPEDNSHSSFHVFDSNGNPMTKIKFRVMTVSSAMKIEGGGMMFSTEVTAARI